MKALLLSLCFVLMATVSFAGGFSNKSVKGCYGFEFHGVVVQGSAGAPIAASGRLCSSGNGKISELTRVLHVPGSVLHQEATGGYTVNPDGTGKATFDVTMGGVPFSTESFHFTITDKNKTLVFVNGTMTGPDGTPTGSDTIVSGVAHKQ